jgi:hypothetical protein
MVKQNKNNSNNSGTKQFNRTDPIGNGNKQEIVSIAYEEIGFFPRSFSRVLDRFLKQVFSDVENLVIQEYRFYRYLFLTTLQCLLILFFVPFLVNFFAKSYLVRPLAEYFWNTQQTEIFLNSYQQKRAFSELKDFEEKIYFESLIIPTSKTYYNINNINNIESEETIKTTLLFPKSSESKIIQPELKTKVDLEPTRQLSSVENFTEIDLQPNFFARIQNKNKTDNHIMKDVSLIKKENSKKEAFEQRLQDKTIELALRYNNQSIEAITNFFADLLSFLTLCYLLFILEIQINITKSFILEVFFGLDDSKKSLLILLITDLLVGYHSSNLWELFFEFLFNHYGLPESQTGIFLLVATLPVLLDVLFKYLIFRHLNRSSPATVATYHAMIE